MKHHQETVCERDQWARLMPRSGGDVALNTATFMTFLRLGTHRLAAVSGHTIHRGTER